jgi:hypothetical protein
MAGRHKAEAQIWAAARPLLDPFVEYVRALTWEPPVPQRILSGQVGPARLARFLFASVALNALIAALLAKSGIGAPLRFFDIPIIDDAIGAGLVAVLGAGLACLVWPALRWAGGTGSLGHTIEAGVYTAAFAYPLLTASRGTQVWLWFIPHYPRYMAVLCVLYFLLIAAPIHQLAFPKVLLVASIPVAILLVLTLAIAHAVGLALP